MGCWGIVHNRRQEQNNQPDKTSQQARVEHLISHPQAVHTTQNAGMQGLPGTHTTELDCHQPERLSTHAFWKVTMETQQDKRYSILIDLHSTE
jgi:hypothetical protein